MSSAGLEIQWEVRGYVYMFWRLMASQKAYARRVSDAENLSVLLVSEEEIFCLLNPTDKTDINMFVTQTFIQVFT